MCYPILAYLGGEIYVLCKLWQQYECRADGV